MLASIHSIWCVIPSTSACELTLSLYSSATTAKWSSNIDFPSANTLAIPGKRICAMKSTVPTSFVGIEVGRELVGVKLRRLAVRLVENLFSCLAESRRRAVPHETFDRSCDLSILMKWWYHLADGFAIGNVPAKHDGGGGSFADIVCQFEAAHRVVFVVSYLNITSTAKISTSATQGTDWRIGTSCRRLRHPG